MFHVRFKKQLSLFSNSKNQKLELLFLLCFKWKNEVLGFV